MSEAAVRTRNLSKRYGGRPALEGIDLEIGAGEFLALLGPNGAGKSTLLRLLCALSRPSAGEVWLFGQRLERGPGASGGRRALGYVGHSLLAYRPLSVRQNLEFFARLYALDRPRERVEAVLRRFGLGDREHDALGSLSRGLQQRVSLARAFLHEPALLLLDEPFNALDAGACAALAEHLRQAHRSGRTIVLVTHDLGRAAGLAARVAILRRGRLAHAGAAPADLPAWRDLYRRAAGEEAA